MDPFEASTQFTQILRLLNPQMQSLLRAAHFALKNTASEDYLSQAIIDVVKDQKVALNTKSTIFQFIEVLIHELFLVLEQAKSSYNYPYVQTLTLQLPRVLLQTLPGLNCLALHNVYISLKNILATLKFNCLDYVAEFQAARDQFTPEDVQNIANDVSFPPITEDDILPEKDHLASTWKLLVLKKKQSQYERLRQLQHLPLVTSKSVGEDVMFSIKKDKEDPALLLLKRQVLARMEDDRESHKRSKETLWMVQRDRAAHVPTEDEFLHYYWNKSAQLNVDEEHSLLADLEDINRLVALSYKDSQL